MSAINEIGLRNEHWRAQLGTFKADTRYARLLMTRGVSNHPRGWEAIVKLLRGPEQSHDDIDPRGERDMLKLELGGTKFYLKVDMYARAEELQFFSEDPADDEKTVRVFTVLLADEY